MYSQLKKADLEGALQDFAAVMQSNYGLTLEDFGVEESELREHLSQALAQGQSPGDVAEWYGRKYDLTPMSSTGF